MADLRAGTIYDIGYQHYDGERLGRSDALVTLTVHGLRTIFGFGRGARAKVIPFLLTGMALVPAIIQAWIGSVTGNLIRVVSYETFFPPIAFLLLLLCAAQAPELVSTDQKNRVLPLYFSRPLLRRDYVMGKFIALATAVFAIMVASQFIVLAGRVFSNEDVLEGLTAEQGAVLPILSTALLAALLLAGISLGIAAFFQARARASAAIIAFILLAAAASNILRETLPADAARYAWAANPFQSMAIVTYWFFGVAPPARSPMARADLPEWVYFAVVVAYVVAAVGALALRYRRLRA